MSPYLAFNVGTIEHARGRALIYVRDQGELIQSPKLFDIDGAALKEAILYEMYEGRLIAMDVFDPFVNIIPFTKLLNYKELVDYASREKLDLLEGMVSHVEQVPESIIEQTSARYTTIYRENVYLRTVRQLANEIFSLRLKTPEKSHYVGMFKLAYWICMFTRVMREQDPIDIAYCRKNLLELRKEIAILDVKKIYRALKTGKNSKWMEIADYVDTFYLTLKKHYPLSLNRENHLHVKKESLAWLKEGAQALYEEYFLAVFREQYERALELKQLIEKQYASQSLNGCSNS